MAGPLVETKLFRPRPRRSLVARPRLDDPMSQGSNVALTLISAPAGFGKTTLLTAWSAAAPGPVAWLSLDEADRRPGTFWTYLIASLQTVRPGVGAAVLPLLESTQPPIDAVIATVLNELAAVPDEIHLVLDDYHLVDGPEISAGMTFLLEHLPPQVHLVISTRADPLLPLARLRARGELAEIRLRDLRFTPGEVAAYLNDSAGLNLSTKDVAALEERTEGWIAALQLAALSLQGRADISGFIAGFAGDDRYIVDYLVEEVLQRQTATIRVFLLRTSILDRLSGPLCDAVTGDTEGRSTLESLDRSNLFVVPLDDNRQWYRYHHLFGDMLRAHLLDERAGEIAELHRRASRWYDQQGQPIPAVRHALAAGDVERAADLVELAIPALQRIRQEATIRAWLDVIPDDVVRRRPVLAVGFIGALMSGNEFDGVENRLREAERWLEAGSTGNPTATPRAGAVVADPAQLAHLPGAIEMYRAALALIAGDVPKTLWHAQLAIDRAAPDDHVIRAGASGLSGLALWSRGELDAAHAAYSACVAGLQKAGHLADVLGCAITLADIRCVQGRLDDAVGTYQRALQLSTDSGTLRGTPDMYVGLAQIACERGDLPAASGFLSRGAELDEHLGLPQNAYRRRVSMARIRESAGDLAGAVDLLDQAERVYVGDFSPNVRPVPALRARLLVRQGNVSAAMGWVREQGLSVADDLSYVREFEHLTLCRVLLALYAADGNPDSLAAAAGLLQRLLAAADAGGRVGSVIEIQVLLAISAAAGGDTAGAHQALDRALTLAEPQGYQQVFVAETPAILSLLKSIARQRPHWEFPGRLLAAADGSVAAQPVPHGNRQNEPARRKPPSIEPLTDRELDVLRLLATDLDGPDIARRLYISVNTLRTHTKSIYAKLGVNSRRAAVSTATEHSLLPGKPNH